LNCKIKDCNKPAEVNGLCNIHHYRSIWLDNSDINNLGIVSFAESVVPEWVRNPTAFFQKEVFYNFFQMYNKKHKNKYDRLLCEIAFRGAAKTTGAKILLLYICCFGLEKFVIYCSETNTFAVQDIFEVRRELSTNPFILNYFGVVNSKQVQGQDGEWSKDAYLTSTGVYVLARGVGQQVRSALRNSYRPTLAIINDMDSKNTVKTDYTRNAQQSWFFNDMFNAVDDIEGKVFFNGTIIHEDTVAVVIKGNNEWKTLEYPVMNLDDFHDVLKLCKVTERDVELPSDEVLLQGNYRLTWGDRLSLKYILTKYREAYKSNQIDGFYQEYFHVVVPPSAKSFINIRHARMRYFYQGGMSWLGVIFGDNGNEQIFPVRVSFGVDPASSTKAHAKFSVIAIMMMNQHRQVFYFDYSRGRYGLRDELRPEAIGLDQTSKVCLDRSLIVRTGIVDEEIRFAKQYHPNSSQIETTQSQEHVFTEILRLMSRNDANHSVFSEKPVQEKIERDADMLVPDFQTGSAFINFGLDELENEMKSFPRGSTVDIIDAFYHARCRLVPPPDVRIEDIRRMRAQANRELITDFHLL